MEKSDRISSKNTKKMLVPLRFMSIEDYKSQILDGSGPMEQALWTCFGGKIMKNECVVLANAN